MTEPEVLLEMPFAIESNHAYAITYNYPGPLPCLSGVQSGCSQIVDAGPALGTGRFCNYAVACAGLTVTIFYESFQRAT